MSSTRKLEILYYTPYFRETICEAIGFAPKLAEDLCVITQDHDRLKDADAVVFHIPNFKEFPQEKRPGQLWVAMSMESDVNYPLQVDPEFMRNFDITMNYRLSSDVPMLYFHPHQIAQLASAPKPKTRSAPAVYFASNNLARNNRYELVGELMKHMPVDSYGKSQNNCNLESLDTGRQSKLDTIGSYLFYFAFENSSSIDYVSEKMYDGLIAGTVPVYLGAPNIDQYLPGENCIIKAEDFPTAADLAKHLLALAQDKDAYESYLSWKKLPLKKNFLDLIKIEETPPIRRLCAKISEHPRFKGTSEMVGTAVESIAPINERQFHAFENVDSCPLCNSLSFKFCLKPDIWRCHQCRVMFRNPRPTQQEIIRSYETGLTYAQWQKETNIREILWRERVGIVSRHMSSGKLLDIGTGDGFFLSLLGTRYDISSTEISTAGALHANQRGFSPRIGDFLELDYTDESFDVITLWHVLEHVLQPGRLLRKIHKVLKTNGILALAVPNEQHSLIFNAWQEMPLGKLEYGQEIHVTHFLPGVLKNYLKKNGFDLLEFGVDDVHVERPFRTKLLFHASKCLNSNIGWHCDKAMYLVARKHP